MSPFDRSSHASSTSSPSEEASFADVLSAELAYVARRRSGGRQRDPATSQDEECLLNEYRSKQLTRARRRHFAKARREIESLLDTVKLQTGEDRRASQDALNKIDEILQQAENNANRDADAEIDKERQRRQQDAVAQHTKTTEARKQATAIRSARDGKRNKSLAPSRDDIEHQLVKGTLRDAADRNLVGLALSGGGIRSATFNLGLLQGLADLGLIKRLDYLSTVSGGGYIGSWLAAWIYREKDVVQVEKQLRNSRVKQAEGRKDGNSAPVEDEPDPIHHLRSYSNYLAPRPSLMSTDAWVLVTIYLRNLALNQLMLIPAIISLLLLPRFVLLFYYWGESATGGDYVQIALLVIIGSLLILASIVAWMGVNRVREPSGDRRRRKSLSSARIGVLVILPLVLASVLCSWFAWDAPLRESNETEGRNILATWLRSFQQPEHEVLSACALFGAIAVGIYSVVNLLLFVSEVVCALRSGLCAAWAVIAKVFWFEYWKYALYDLVAAFLGGALVGSAFAIGYQFWRPPNDVALHDQVRQLALIMTFGPAVILVAFFLATIIWIGLMGRDLTDPEREWWASLNGNVLRAAFLLFVYFGLALFGVPLLILATPIGVKLLTSGWALTTATGLLAAGSSKTGKSRKAWPLEVLARAAPFVFLIGLMVALAQLLHAVLDNPPAPSAVATTSHSPSEPEVHVIETVDEDNQAICRRRTRRHDESVDYEAQRIKSYWSGIFGDSSNAMDDKAQAMAWHQLAFKWGACLAACGAVSLIASWYVGVNRFSLQQMYAYRLIRCYLGASRRKRPEVVPQGAKTNVSEVDLRDPDPITGFDPHDDFPLAKLAETPTAPYLLVNTALNLVQDADLAWQERKAAAFILSPHYAGNRLTRYRSMPDYGGSVTLGEAVSISGAAASPNMGYHSSPAVTALLTIFNVRLGAWMANPTSDSSWRLREPRMSLALLLSELMGWTNRRSRFVYLSDGGHFENLGAYELVRRRCRYIIVSDAGADPNFDFYDLGGLIRKCRTDLGVPIEIDVTPIKPNAEDRSKWHCAIGLIRYDYVDPEAVPGMLVYVKSSITGNEPSDVLNYAHEHPSFPHQATTDQFFSESQFESYRALGHHVAQEVFSDGMRGVESSDLLTEEAHQRIVPRLFSNLNRRWFPPPPQLEENYLESVKPCIELIASLRDDDNLRELSLSMFPELEKAIAETPAHAGTADPRRAELHMIEQVLEVMETAWIGVRLDGSQAHPLNRGWMNAFRRWASSSNLRRHWQTLRGEYSQDFVRFCEDELKLERGEINVYLFITCPGFELTLDWLRLQQEFSNEWPGEKPLELNRESVREFALFGPGYNVRAEWLISAAGYLDPWPQRWNSDQFPYGVIFLLGNDNDDVLELFIWIRGAYRNQHIGRECLDAFLPELVHQLTATGPMPRLRVRLPEANRPGSPNTSQKGIWLSLFHKYGFRIDRSPQYGGDLVLVREA